MLKPLVLIVHSMYFSKEIAGFRTVTFERIVGLDPYLASKYKVQQFLDWLRPPCEKESTEQIIGKHMHFIYVNNNPS